MLPRVDAQDVVVVLRESVEVLDSLVLGSRPRDIAWTLKAFSFASTH